MPFESSRQEDEIEVTSDETIIDKDGVHQSILSILDRNGKTIPKGKYKVKDLLPDNDGGVIHEYVLLTSDNGDRFIATKYDYDCLIRTKSGKDYKII